MKRFNWIQASTKEHGSERLLIREGRSDGFQARVSAIYDSEDLSGKLVVEIVEVDDVKKEVGRRIVSQAYRVPPGMAGGMKPAHIELMRWTEQACQRLEEGEPAGDTPELAFELSAKEQIAHACGMLTGFVMLKMWPEKRRKEEFTAKQRAFADTLEDGLKRSIEDYWRDGDAKNTDQLHEALVAAVAEARKKLRLTKKQAAVLEDVIDTSKQVVAAMKLGINPIATPPKPDGRTIH